MERHVVFRIRRGLTILRDVSTQIAEIARMARPHPVVDVAAVLADRQGRRIDHAHVLDLEPLDQLVAVSAAEGRDIASVTGLLAALHEAFLRLVDRRVAREAVHARRHARVDLPGHVGDLLGHVDPLRRIGRQFLAARMREKTGVDQVLLRRRVVLQGAEAAMVVRHDQTIGRHERGGASPEADDGAHRITVELAQGLRREREAAVLERAGEGGKLSGLPHAFVGAGGGAREHRERGKCGKRSGGKRGERETHRILIENERERASGPSASRLGAASVAAQGSNYTDRCARQKSFDERCGPRHADLADLGRRGRDRRHGSAVSPPAPAGRASKRVRVRNRSARRRRASDASRRHWAFTRVSPDFQAHCPIASSTTSGA